MANATYFVQECPTCGRALQVRVEYLGKRLVCQHCGGQVLAADPEGAPSRASRLMERAEQLLQSTRRAPGCA